MNGEAIAGVALFAAVSLAIVEHFYQPIVTFLSTRSDARPNLALAIDILDFAEQYIQAIVAGLLCWFAGVNLFDPASYPQMPLVLGRVLTALVALFAQDIVSRAKSWPRELAQEQYASTVMLREQGVLPISLGAVSYVSEEKPESK